MKRYCIDNQNGYCHLTFGKEYEVLEETEEYYIIKNDAQNIKKYLKDKFTDSTKINKIIDKINNPNDYYNPIELELNVKGKSIEITKIILEEQLLGIGDIQEFLNIKSLYGIKISSKYKHSNISNNSLDLGRKIENIIISSSNFSNNKSAIEFGYKIQKEIEHINKTLTMTKKQRKLVYLIEHEPNGKQYNFRSNEPLYINELVICDTLKGEKYGLIKGMVYENINEYMNRKICKKIK